MAKKPKVVILGAGFGGLWAARKLANDPVDILLVDKNNYHTFLPLLYQVAAAELEPERIAQPVRYLIRDQANLNFRMGSVTAISPAGKTVSVDGEPLSYDYLIVALGSTTAFFGVPGAEEHCFTLKSNTVTSAPNAARIGACCPPPPARQSTFCFANSGPDADSNQDLGTALVGVTRILHCPSRAAWICSGVMAW